VDAVLAGGADESTPLVASSFQLLYALAEEESPTPELLSRPFDAGRAGLNLGEGAAFVVLETEEAARKRGADILARFTGFGNACDAFHQTASSETGEGAWRAMCQALDRAGLAPSEIDYINAHGTGTPNNDASESAALRRLFGEAMPPVSSTKSLTGHTTSASGAIEAVFCLLALRYDFVPAQYAFTTPDPACIVPTRGGEKALRNVLCNSFGFGGNDSSILLSHA
ncbi:MAG: beta-ketoacyl-[acyl-carrier-protein] synthase family protein, partial [Bacteroidales bacterium]|nr:beta-ketoacyl-[acyl-carrier-protein] synthase family protein [Bacteroidales bacterium]